MMPWFMRRVSWFNNSASKSTYVQEASRVARRNVVMKALNDGFRPLTMYEIRSLSSTGLFAAASWSAHDLANWRYSEQDRDSCHRVCNWRFKCAMQDFDWEAYLVAKRTPDLARCVQSINCGKNIRSESCNYPTQDKLVLFVPKHIFWVLNLFFPSNCVLVRTQLWAINNAQQVIPSQEGQELRDPLQVICSI